MGRKKKTPPTRYVIYISRTKYSQMYEGYLNCEIDKVKEVVEFRNHRCGHYVTVLRKNGGRNVKLLVMNCGKILFNKKELDFI